MKKAAETVVENSHRWMDNHEKHSPSESRKVHKSRRWKGPHQGHLMHVLYARWVLDKWMVLQQEDAGRREASGEEAGQGTPWSPRAWPRSRGWALNGRGSSLWALELHQTVWRGASEGPGAGTDLYRAAFHTAYGNQIRREKKEAERQILGWPQRCGGWIMNSPTKG